MAYRLVDLDAGRAESADEHNVTCMIAHGSANPNHTFITISADGDTPAVAIVLTAAQLNRLIDCIHMLQYGHGE